MYPKQQNGTSQRLMNIYSCVSLIYINVVDAYECNQSLAFAVKSQISKILMSWSIRY